MNIQLSRPIAFLDLETTGVNLGTDRIVEIAIVRIKPDGTRKIMRTLLNPEMRISDESTSIHGISNEMVKDAPTFKQAAGEIKQFLDGCDLGGYNSNKFDIPLLVEEFLRVGVDFQIEKRKCIDAQRIYHLMEPRNLSAALRFYCGKELENAHSAEADTMATYEILMAQLDRYPELENDMKSLSEFTTRKKIADFAGMIAFDADNEEIFTFG